jgi:hypothetical protein
MKKWEWFGVNERAAKQTPEERLASKRASQATWKQRKKLGINANSALLACASMTFGDGSAPPASRTPASWHPQPSTSASAQPSSINIVHSTSDALDPARRVLDATCAAQPAKRPSTVASSASESLLQDVVRATEGSSDGVATAEDYELELSLQLARTRIARAAAWRTTTEREMETWRAEEQARMAQADAEEADAAAAGRPAHRRVMRLSPYAPRLLRSRPAVEAVTWDGQPLLPVSTIRRHDGTPDAAVAEQLRAAQRTKFDGTTPPPARAAAQLSDERRRQGQQCRGPAAPAVVNAPAARTLVHPSGGYENGKPQHVFHEPMMDAVQAQDGRLLKPRDAGPDVQIVEVRTEERAALDDEENLLPEKGRGVYRKDRGCM